LVFLDQLVAKSDQLRVNSKLQNRFDLAACLRLKFGKGIQIPRIQHQWFLANGIGMDSERKADVRVVEIVGRADADPVELLFLALAAQLLGEAIEAFKFGEKAYIEGILIQDAYGVIGIQGGNEPIACVSDGFHVSGGNVASGTNKGKVSH
jgi:hypothetical protein